jgi:cytochrome P450
MPFRRAIAVALERTDVESVCRSAGDELETLIVSCPENDSFDFMSRISAPVATTFACRLMGLPQISAGAYDSIFLRITRAMDSSLEPERQGPGVAATHELNALVADAMAHAEPGSIVYELLQDEEVRRMAAGYVRNTISAMFNAAYSTAYTSMGGFLKLILENPRVADQISTLQSHGAAVQELLRLTSPAQATMRFAANDLELGGMSIRKTDPVITLLASANHDSAQFERPDEFIPDRAPNAHLGFGWGPHFCVGALPAQQFLRHYLQRICWHIEDLHYSCQSRWLDTVTLRCLESLQLVKTSKSDHARKSLKTGALKATA